MPAPLVNRELQEKSAGKKNHTRAQNQAVVREAEEAVAEGVEAVAAEVTTHRLPL